MTITRQDSPVANSKATKNSRKKANFFGRDLYDINSILSHWKLTVHGMNLVDYSHALYIDLCD